MSIIFFLLSCINPKPQSYCKASTDWIQKPLMPTEINDTESFCDFYQFSWQSFLAQVSPSSKKNERVFETNRVYDPNIPKDQCSLNLLGKQSFVNVLNPRTIKADKFEHVEADGGALYDQNGNILYYGVYYSDELCSSSEKGFASGTLEIKTSWIQLKEESKTHYSITLDDGKNLGLVGIHFALWTPKHPEMIWATWEHKDNSPLCNGTSPKQKWAFASKKAAKCLQEHKTLEPYLMPTECSEFEFNIPQKYKGEVPLKGTPTNVCRMYAYGNQYDESINGNDTSENLQAILDLNEQLVGKNGYLTKLHKMDPMQIWSNYEMIGALWTKDGKDSGKLPINNKQGPADSSSPQRGSLELTNSSMETFQQGSNSFVPNCFGCHNYDSDEPLEVSHIQQHLLGK